jgi:non-ribosomal peptide synthetase component E (peptide arylation enzyme)
MAYGVTPRMIEAYGDIVFDLSLNKQRRHGDPVRQLDLKAVEAQRADTGLADVEIAERVGLAVEQVRYIRVVMERRRFRTDQYRKLFALGGGRRWRPERYADPAASHEVSAAAQALRAVMDFDPAQVRKFLDAGWWQNDTLSGWLAAHAAEAPERPAIVAGERALSYREVADQTARLAGALAELGIGRGDVVSVQLPNTPEFLIAFLAITALGGVMSTIHMPYRATEIETLLGHSRARAAICLGLAKDFSPAETILGLKPRLPGLEHVIAVGEAPAAAHPFADLVAQGKPVAPASPPAGADPFLLLYTSGTTAAPKGVPLSYQNMLGNARLSAPEHQITADDVLLSAAPFSHLFALYSFHLALAAGATNLLLPAFTPPDLAAAIEVGRPTVLFTAPAHLAACLGAGLFDKHDISSLRLAIVSGSACAPDIARAFDAKMANGAMTQLWGMTETQAGLYTRPGDGIEVAATSAGRPSPGTEVRVAGLDNLPLGHGEEGELQVRGSLLFPGYYDNAEANAEAFTPDGWFRTGDLAVMDEAGNVSLTGRIKDLINRGGVKYNPLDVETLLDQHPKVQQSAVVPVPDPVLGEKACCFVVPGADGPPTLEELCDYLLERDIAKTKLPERLELVDEMPLTPTRKIIKGRLKTRLEGG